MMRESFTQGAESRRNLAKERLGTVYDQIMTEAREQMFVQIRESKSVKSFDDSAEHALKTGIAAVFNEVLEQHTEEISGALAETPGQLGRAKVEHVINVIKSAAQKVVDIVQADVAQRVKGDFLSH